MGKFRQKALQVEATQWNGYSFNEGETIGWLQKAFEQKKCSYEGSNVVIETMKGLFIAKPGDWIVSDEKGDILVMEPGIFTETYDMVASSSDLQGFSPEKVNATFQSELRQLINRFGIDSRLGHSDHFITDEVLKIFDEMERSKKVADKITDNIDLLAKALGAIVITRKRRHVPKKEKEMEPMNIAPKTGIIVGITSDGSQKFICWDKRRGWVTASSIPCNDGIPMDGLVGWLPVRADQETATGESVPDGI